jgi:hypothetical protein
MKKKIIARDAKRSLEQMLDVLAPYLPKSDRQTPRTSQKWKLPWNRMRSGRNKKATCG